MSGRLTLLDEDLGELVTLLLATDVGAEALLEELERTLIFRHTQQLHSPTLERRKAGDLAHNASDELVVLGQTLEKLKQT